MQIEIDEYQVLERMSVKEIYDWLSQDSQGVSEFMVMALRHDLEMGIDDDELVAAIKRVLEFCS